MSNIYIQEPSTEGKVLLVTSAGDLDVELWSREAPKACRNFVQLCLEGYYNGTIFHRVIPGFIVQGGDPSGTGEGGESIYGKPFRDEFHTRLRFVRRGLVAMANATPHDNGSQFFFTLGPTPELQNKHTIFGKITGNTLYNLSRFEEGVIGKDDRPEYPFKILTTEVLNNPFPDIVPRLKIQNEVPKEERKEKKKKGTKNFKLLSFGDEAEEEEEEVLAATKNFSTKGNSAHDIAMDPTLSASTGRSATNATDALERIKRKLRREESLEALKSEVMDSDTLTEDFTLKPLTEQHITKKLIEMKEDMKEESNEVSEELRVEPIVAAAAVIVAEDKVADDTEEDTEPLKDYKMEKAKYEEEKRRLPRKGASREELTLALLQRFTAKVTKAVYDEHSGSEEEHQDDDDASRKDNDDDNDEGWLKHRFHFETSSPVLAKDASTKDDNWYDVNDPRNVLNKRRREDTSRQSKKYRK